MRNRAARPSDEILEKSYATIAQRLDDLLRNAGDVRSGYEADKTARDLRAPKGREKEGHPFMRPVIQKAIARVVCQIVEQRVLSWADTLARLKELPWHIGEAPWLAVFNDANAKMIGAKENTQLLDDLLYVHLAAPSKQSITKARRQFKEVRGENYPVSEQDLLANLAPHTDNRPLLTADADAEPAPTDVQSESPED
jgi:DNA sulfur modification protein DndB